MHTRLSYEMVTPKSRSKAMQGFILFPLKKSQKRTGVKLLEGCVPSREGKLKKSICPGLSLKMGLFRMKAYKRFILSLSCISLI
jgi:hypothetical protein